MTVADNKNTTPTTQEEDIHVLRSLFSSLEPQQVETFYKSYQQWQLVQQGVVLQEQLATIEQQIIDNNVLMQLTQPSPIALAALIRLQSYGVDDVDLLDNMLERGDTWLDHMLQLLEQCQNLGFIRDNYTEWCKHALEGAYDWLDSMHENEERQVAQLLQEELVTQATVSGETTEALLIQRLMSEEANSKIPTGPLEPEPPVGTDISRPLTETIEETGRDELVSTENPLLTIPSILSYPTKAPEESKQHEEAIPGPTPPVHEVPALDIQQKSHKRGLLSRILSKAWHT